MPAKSVLTFKGYKIDKMSFSLNDVDGKKRDFQIAPEFSKSVVEHDNNTYEVILSVGIHETDDVPVPFDLFVEMTGYFELLEGLKEDFQRNLLNRNAIAIMYPFLRAAVSSITATANVTSLVLPVINLASEFEKTEDD